MDDYRGKIKHPLEIANDKLSQEIKQLQHDNEVLYRANCEISEVADRLREALERIANFPVLLKSLVQSDRATIHGLKDIARAALEVRK